METHNQEWLRDELIQLTEKQINTLEKRTFGGISEAEQSEYEERQVAHQSVVRVLAARTQPPPWKYITTLGDYFRIARHPTSIQQMLGKKFGGSDDNLQIRSLTAESVGFTSRDRSLSPDLQDSFLQHRLPIQHHRKGYGSA